MKYFIAIPLLVVSISTQADFRFIYNEHTYDVITTPQSWANALLDANARSVNGVSGHLLHIETADENNYIIQLLLDHIDLASFSQTTPYDGGGNSGVWLGANDLATEGRWIWQDNGQQFWQGESDGFAIGNQYNNWGNVDAGEPNNNGPQHTGIICLSDWVFGTTGQWDDVAEDNQLFYIVEYAINDRSDPAWLVSEIYTATLGYAPDDQGLQYWVNNLMNGGWTTTEVAQSFFDQPLVEAMYPIDQGYGPFIDALYQNLFGRDPDASGYSYWLNELESGSVQRNQMIIALIEGGWSNPDAATDMARFGNRVQVGLAFASEQASRGVIYDQLDETQQTMLRQIGREVLADVTADSATRDQAIARIPGLLDQL